MGGSSCGKVVVAVAALAFGPTVLTEPILRGRQGVQQKERERDEIDME